MDFFVDRLRCLPLPLRQECKVVEGDRFHARRFDDLQAFYASIYGKTKGMTIELLQEPPPVTIAIAVGPKCTEAEFSMLLVRSAGKADKPRAHEITVFARGAADGGDYPDSSPWMLRPKKR